MAGKKVNPDIKPGAGRINPFAGPARTMKDIRKETAPKKPLGG